MKIAVNTRLLLPHKLEGIGWFTYEIFKRLTTQKRAIEWIFIFDRPYSGQFIFSDNITPVVTGPPSRHPILWYLWFEYSLPRVFKKYEPDLFVSPDGFTSLHSKIRNLPVIHDLNFEHDNQYVPGMARKYYRRYFSKYARHGTRIASVSQYSLNDIANLYGIDHSKLDLVYNGCGDFFHPLTEGEKENIRQQITRGTPYFIFVGALNPRKNISGMLKAYEKYRLNGGTNKFVIVGEKMFWNEEISNTYQNHPFKEDIIFTGRLEGDGLNRILGSANALMFVSHFEGFGIPIVEAFKCKVPVITSTTTSMPEIGGDAALFCEPDNYEQIAEAMHKVSDPVVRIELIAKGSERAKIFTWERSAEMMWESIQKTLAE